METSCSDEQTPAPVIDEIRAWALQDPQERQDVLQALAVLDSLADPLGLRTEA